MIADVAGSDDIHGGAGNDIIFGDVMHTDALATAQGLGTPPDSGWQVFAQLEAAPSWDRDDTIDYIRNNHLALSEEAPRTGGHDEINGGAGNDIIYAQEGNDTITYDVGDGRDFVHGGTEAGGGDTLIVNGDCRGRRTSSSRRSRPTMRVSVRHLYRDGRGAGLDGSGTIMVEMTEIESVTINGGGGADTLTVSGDFVRHLDPEHDHHV